MWIFSNTATNYQVKKRISKELGTQGHPHNDNGNYFFKAHAKNFKNKCRDNSGVKSYVSGC